MPATTQIMPCGGGIACRTGTCAMVGGVSIATPSAATVGAAGGGGGGGGSGLGAALNALPVEIFPSYAPDCPSPAELKEQLRRAHGSGLLCTLSGWVFALLGCFATVGAMCSLLAAAGGHTAPGVLGEMLSPHGLELDHADAGDDEPHPSLWDELMERLMAHLLFASTMALLLLAAVGVDSLLNRRRAARG